MAVLSAAFFAGSVSLFTPPAQADDRHHDRHDDRRKDDRQDNSNVGAAFGRGLNTAQPGNSVNHVILPKRIEVDAGGVVNFALAGFHHIVIFKPGVRREHLDPFVQGNDIFLFPNDPNAPLPPELSGFGPFIYYRGIDPAGGPLATPPTGEPLNASNRGEPVAFLEPGFYLVICNILPHLRDGMYAYVRVNRND